MHASKHFTNLLYNKFARNGAEFSLPLCTTAREHLNDQEGKERKKN